MSGDLFVFDVAENNLLAYAMLPAAHDALLVVLLKLIGLEDDAVLKQRATLAAVLSSTTVEANDVTYSRKILTNINFSGSTFIDADDPIWTGLAGDQIGKIIVVYDPDTTSSTDSTRIPLTAHPFDVTPDGIAELSGQINNFAVELP